MLFYNLIGITKKRWKKRKWKNKKECSVNMSYFIYKIYHFHVRHVSALSIIVFQEKKNVDKYIGICSHTLVYWTWTMNMNMTEEQCRGSNTYLLLPIIVSGALWECNSMISLCVSAVSGGGGGGEAETLTSPASSLIRTTEIQRVNIRSWLCFISKST